MAKGRKDQGGGAAVMDTVGDYDDTRAGAQTSELEDAGPTPAPIAVGPGDEPEVRWIALEDIDESPWNPRKHFSEQELASLAESIRDAGQQEACVVRPIPGTSRYELGAGHRRGRATRRLGRTHLLCIIRPMTDEAFITLLNISNQQREDVHPLEQADAYANMITLLRWDVPRIAREVKESETTVYDTLKLRSLLPAVKELYFSRTDLTFSHMIELSRLSPADQERAIAPPSPNFGDHRIGGLWLRDHGRGDTEQEDLELDEAEGDDATVGLKPISVRELKTWVREHTRFDTAAEHVPVLFPDTVKQLEAAKEEAIKVVHITRTYRVADDARSPDGNRTLGEQSWQRADGLQKSKTCDYSVMGVVVVGPGQGEAFKVCIKKDKCTTHWPDEARAAKQRAEAGAKPAKKGKVKPAAAVQESHWDRTERERKAAVARIKPAIPKIREALIAAVRKAPAKASGALGRLILNNLAVEKTKEFPLGDSADSFVRALAWSEVSSALRSEYSWANGLREVGKELGVDVDAMVDEASPNVEAPAKVAAPKAKPPLGKAHLTKRAGRALVKAVAKPPAVKKPTKRRPEAQFMQPVTPNEKLAAVVGAAPLPRTELTRKLWAYIKRHNLQDKKNRRIINADEKLKAVFGGKPKVSMFDMTKLVAKNLKRAS